MGACPILFLSHCYGYVIDVPLVPLAEFSVRPRLPRPPGGSLPVGAAEVRGWLRGVQGPGSRGNPGGCLV